MSEWVSHVSVGVADTIKLDAGWQPPRQREKIRHTNGAGRRQVCWQSPKIKDTPHQWCGPSPGVLAVAKDKRYAQATLYLRLENINRYAQVTLYLRPENINRYAQATSYLRLENMNKYAQGWEIVTCSCAMISVSARFEDVRGDRKLLVRQD